MLSKSILGFCVEIIRIKSLDYSEENKTLTVQWQGGGCKTVDSTGLQYANTVKGGEVEKKLPVHYGPGK